MYRLNELIKLDRKIYHTNDLALLWKITNKNTLYTAIKRYSRKGVLLPIYKGLYSTVPVSQLDPLELGKAIIHHYTYLSTESVLAQAGVIAQIIYPYTFVSDQPKKVTIGTISFLFRQVKPDYLFNPTGIIDRHGVYVASPERAAADMLYFNPKYHFDVPESLDFEEVKLIQKEVGYSW
jgi:predicted transcriptional regulator of viral defense system